MPEFTVILSKADPNMSEGKILEWLKQEGERVEVGEALANVESEKLEFPVESPVAGVLKRVVAQPGDMVKVAGPLAIIETG